MTAEENTNASVRVWLDDVRPAPEGWIWARTIDEARHLFRTRSVIECSLDHDLGLHELSPEEFDDWDKIISISYALQGAEVETGFDFVNWMVENKCVPETVIIHSWNEAGARRMALRLNECGHDCIVAAFRP